MLRAHVLSNDIIPRMWLSHDPLFNTVKSNEWGANLLKWKEANVEGRERHVDHGSIFIRSEWVFGVLELGTDNAAKRAVVKETANLATHHERLTWQLEDFTSSARTIHAALRRALEHNSQNYVDVMQYLAVNALLVKRK